MLTAAHQTQSSAPNLNEGTSFHPLSPGKSNVVSPASVQVRPVTAVHVGGAQTLHTSHQPTDSSNQ